MYKNRLIPCLLLRDHGIIKTHKFKKSRYLGDPINAVKIYNDKEVDELIFLDIDATRHHREPDFEYLKKITEQCFMPLCYGGGISTIDQIRMLFEIGFEKVSINSTAFYNPNLIREASNIFGAQSIVGAMDVKTLRDGNKCVFLHNARKNIHKSAVEYAVYLESLGVGEIFLNSIDRDGEMTGMDYDLIHRLSQCVSVPIIASGGAGKVEDCVKAVQYGASAAAAGSLFVFWGRNKAVLINYPDKDITNKLFEHI